MVDLLNYLEEISKMDGLEAGLTIEARNEEFGKQHPEYQHLLKSLEYHITVSAEPPNIAVSMFIKKNVFSFV